MEFYTNSLGRRVPKIINGKESKPYMGQGNTTPSGNKVGPPIRNGKNYDKKVLSSLEIAIDKCELKDGMAISFHHHLREGDLIINQVLDILAKKGLKDLVLAPSALFKVHEPIIEHIKNGLISHIEGSMNGAVGRFCTTGGMKKTAILRSHGGRYRSIQDGDLHIDVAFITAPSSDAHGNANGVHGPSACGPLGFALADSLYADKVVLVTDNLVPFPCYPWEIQGGNVDFVVKVDKIGDPNKIVSGTTQITTKPEGLLIANYASQLVLDAGLADEPDFSFQAGAGGMSLAFVKYLGDYLRKNKKFASFARGGSTKYLVDMLDEGLVKYILDGQSFDLAGVKSLRENANHISTNPFVSYNYHTKGCFASKVKAAVLGATEVDLDFNVNVNTHSDGWLLHGIGGFTDCTDSYMTIITAPLVRKVNPIIVDRVHTITAPGSNIDVIVTDQGIAINPKRDDIKERLKNSTLPIISIEELREKAHKITGDRPKPVTTDEPVAVIEYRDGTVIDTVFRLDV